MSSPGSDPSASAPAWPDDAVEVGRILGAWGIKGGIKVAPFAADPQALFSADCWFLKPAPGRPRPSSAASANASAASGKTSTVPAKASAAPANTSAASGKTSAAASAKMSATPAKSSAARPNLPALPSTLHVRGVRDQGDAIVATAAEIADRDAAEALKGARVFVSRASFPAPDPDEFYWVDLIGATVVNRDGVTLGHVVGLIDTGPHCVLRIQPPASGPAAMAAAAGETPERLVPFVEAYVDSVDVPGRRIAVDWGLDY